MTDYIIREAVPDDAQQMLDYLRTLAQEPDNGVALSSVDDVRWTLDEERELIKRNAESETSVMFVVVGDGKVVGISNAHGGNRVFLHTVEMGISLHKDWRGKGIGKAVMRRMVDWAQANPMVTRLELRVFSNNARAIALYEHFGFQREGVLRQAVFKDGVYLDIIYMAILFER